MISFIFLFEGVLYESISILSTGCDKCLFYDIKGIFSFDKMFNHFYCMFIKVLYVRTDSSESKELAVVYTISAVFGVG